MLNPLRRLNNPMPGAAPALRPGTEPDADPTNHYMVEGDANYVRPTAALRVVHGLQAVLLIIVAVLSFAVFWLIGLMLNIF